MMKALMSVMSCMALLALAGGALGAERTAVVPLFGNAPVTERFELPESVRTNEYVLSFEATFPKGAPRAFKLLQWFPRSPTDKTLTEMHTGISFPGMTRTLGNVVYGKHTGTPWFNPSFTETKVEDGETRRVKIVCHAGAISYYLEYGGRMYRALVNRVQDNYRLTGVQFDELGKDGAQVKISNVRIKPIGPDQFPRGRKGWQFAAAPTTFVIPVEEDETRFSFVPGGYPVKIAMRFADGSDKPPELTLDSFSQRASITAKVLEKMDGQGVELFQSAKKTGSVLWEDSGLTLSGLETGSEKVAIFTRAKLSGRYRGDQLPEIITNAAAYGECAANHVFDFRLEKRDGRYRLWIDGNFAREIPAREISGIALDVPPLAQMKVQPVQAKKLSPLVEPLPDRAPFAVAKCRENMGSHSLEHDGYRSRQPFEGLPDCYLRRVPVGTYVKARVKCRLAGDLKKDTRITARLTNFGINGSDNGVSPDAMTQQTKTIARVPGQDVYTVEFDFDPGRIQDVIWQLGCESLHFEVLGGVIPTTFFAVSQDKPDEKHPSDVVVLGSELLRAPAGMCVRNGSFGNLFYAADGAPHLTAEVEALVAGDYTVGWTLRDINGKTLETHVDRGTFAAGARQSFKQSFNVRAPGWYEVVTTLSSADGTPCVTRTSSFVLQPPDTRKAGFDSPYFTWTPWCLADVQDREVWKPWIAFYRRFGIHHATVNRYSEDFFGDYPMTVSPLPNLGCCTDSSKEKRQATYEAKVGDFKRRFPHARMATVLHENYGGETPLEIIGGTSVIDEKQRENDELWTLRAREMASAYRKLWPEVKLSLGNSGGSLGVAGELYRGKLPKELIDFVGEESVGATTPPEITVGESFWLIREEAKKFGYDHVMPCACYEWKSRPRRNFASERQLAAFKVRDALVAHAWRSPSITIGTGAEPSTCYFTTSWGGGVFSRAPLMQPFPGAAANATLTLVLDRCTFRRLVPTGSKSVYCLEFTRGGEFVYALWSARGALDATVLTKARKVTRTDLYGASTDAGRPSTSRVKTEISEEPCYLTMDGPIQSVELSQGSRRYPFDTYPGMERARELVRFDAPCEILTGKRVPGGFGAARGQLPTIVPGDFDCTVVDDDEKGKVVELTLKTEKPIPSPLFKEYGFVELKKPVEIPAGANTLALDVKGNSCFGKVSALLVDAKGKTFAFQGRGGECYFDQPGKVAINFDGWCRLSFPLTADSPAKNFSIAPHEQQWRCTNGGIDTPMTPPLKLTGFGATLRRKTLYLTDMQDSSSLSVRFAGAAVY